MSEETLRRASLALDQTDEREIERLRGSLLATHVPQLAESWRASLPWSRKHLYVSLLMDHKHPCLEPMMRDALLAPNVETRAYAVCYLLGSHARFEKLLTPSGFVDETKVAEAIAEWRRDRGEIDVRPCPHCGAPLKPAQQQCAYCGVNLFAGRSSEDQWQLEIGIPKSATDDTLASVTSQFDTRRVAMRFRVRRQPEIALANVHIQLFLRQPPSIKVAAVAVASLDPASSDCTRAFALDQPGDYELRVINPTSRAVLASQRFVVR